MEEINKSIAIMRSEMDQHLDKQRITNMLTIADQFVKAGCFTKDVNNVFQAFTKLQAGAEMGMPPMESMTSLYIVNGNVTMWGKALTTRLRKFGWAIKYDDSKTNECTATITKGEETYSYTSTKAELEALKSRAAGFALKDKLKWHAISRICRFYVPEVLGSISYVAEEIEGLPNNFPTTSTTSIEVEGSKLAALKAPVEELAQEAEVVEVNLGELKKKSEPEVSTPTQIAPSNFYDDLPQEPTQKTMEAASEVFGTPTPPVAVKEKPELKLSARERKIIRLEDALEKNVTYNFDRALKAFNVSNHSDLNDSQLDICIQAVEKNKQF